MKSEVSRLNDAADLLLRAEQQDSQRLRDVRARLLRVARLTTIDRVVYDNATIFTDTFSLDFPDAVHLAAVLADAATVSAPSIFLNRNKNTGRSSALPHGKNTTNLGTSTQPSSLRFATSASRPVPSAGCRAEREAGRREVNRWVTAPEGGGRGIAPRW